LIVLGIDPGLATVGFGVVNFENNRTLTLIDYGTIDTKAGLAMPRRLEQIAEGITELIEKFRPDAVAFEELFFNTNVKTAITVAQARGVALLAAYKLTHELYEYTPLQVKQAVVGYGRAEKQQVQIMVKTLCGLREIPKPDDAADAVAVAICHAHSAKTSGILNTRV
jgi:crossover junction endodeoxyribonuclease RuvC